MRLYEANLFNGQRDWNATEGAVSISNGEITVSRVNSVRYISVDLLRYKQYIVDFELFNSGDNRIRFGIIDGINNLDVIQDIATTIFSIYGLYVKTLDYNIYNITNQWKNIKIIRNLSKSTLFIENSRFDINHPIRGRYLWFYKWYIEYIKVRNIRITVLSSMTCKANKPNNFHNLNLFLIVSFHS